MWVHGCPGREDRDCDRRLARDRAGGLAELFKEVDEFDILVNNAAINPLIAIADVTEEDYDRAMAVNIKGPYFAIQHAAGKLRDGGRIINLSTLNTVVPTTRASLYITSKAALEALTMVAARELGSRQITVNTISPGSTDTELLHASNPGADWEMTKRFTALGRLGRPVDIANVVAFLAGPDSQWITGQNLRVTGGMIV